VGACRCSFAEREEDLKKHLSALIDLLCLIAGTNCDSAAKSVAQCAESSLDHYHQSSHGKYHSSKSRYIRLEFFDIFHLLADSSLTETLFVCADPMIISTA
jgi:hypothetical protein